jgi:pilus assembly protein CpaE
MDEVIKILLSFGKTDLRVDLKRRLFSIFREVEVVGEASSSTETMELVRKRRPHLLLVGTELDGGDGIEVSRMVTTSFPCTGVIIVADRTFSQERIRGAMLAGVRAFLTHPIQDEELKKVVEEVYEIIKRQREEISAKAEMKRRPKIEPKIVTILATKGGVGGTTLAVNLATSLAKIHQEEGERVALIDLDLQFGDAAIMLNLSPTRTIAGLVREMTQTGNLDKEILDTYLLKHSTGLSLLAAPLKPEQSELVRPEHLEKILDMMSLFFAYTIIDTPKFIQETLLVTLSYSTLILLVLTLDLPSIKNSKLGLEILESLGFKNKVRIVVNRNESGMGIAVDEVEDALKCPIMGLVPSSGRVVVSSVNEGTPFVLLHERTDVARAITSIAYKIAGKEKEAGVPKAGLWAKRVLGLK